MGDEDINFHLRVTNGDVHFSFGKHAPPYARVLLLICYAATLVFFAGALVMHASWPAYFAFFMFAVSLQVETWTWKAVARRCALGMYGAIKANRDGQRI